MAPANIRLDAPVTTDAPAITDAPSVDVPVIDTPTLVPARVVPDVWHEPPPGWSGATAATTIRWDAGSSRTPPAR